MRFSVLAVSKMDCQKSMRRTGLFERVETAFSAVCKTKMGVYSSLKSSASMAVANGKWLEEREKV